MIFKFANSYCYSKSQVQYSINNISPCVGPLSSRRIYHFTINTAVGIKNPEVYLLILTAKRDAKFPIKTKITYHRLLRVMISSIRERVNTPWHMIITHLKKRNHMNKGLFNIPSSYKIDSDKFHVTD